MLIKRILPLIVSSSTSVWVLTSVFLIVSNSRLLSSHSSFRKNFSISPSTLIKKCTARPKKTYQFQVLFDFTHSLCSRAPCTLTFCVIRLSPRDVVDTCIFWVEKIITFHFYFSIFTFVSETAWKLALHGWKTRPSRSTLPSTSSSWSTFSSE